MPEVVKKPYELGKLKVKPQNENSTELSLSDESYALYQTLQELISALGDLTIVLRNVRLKNG